MTELLCGEGMTRCELVPVMATAALPELLRTEASAKEKAKSEMRARGVMGQRWGG